MNIAPLASVLALSYFAAMTANAASFDCKKAKSEVEKMICADAELSILDEHLSDLYRNILKSTAKPEDQDRIRREQKLWLRERDKCFTAPCVASQYNDRQLALAERVYSGNSVKSPKSYPPYPDIWELRAEGISI